MAKTILRAILKDGSTVISEFSKMAKVGKYVSEVLTGGRAFNAWTVVATIHPTSGGEALIRERRFISPTLISEIQEVVEAAPGVYAPKRETQRGPGGLWTAPENGPAGAVAGVDYPVFRDDMGQRYVVLATAPTEVRHTLDSTGWNGERITPETIAPRGGDLDESDFDSGFDGDL